MSKASQKRIVVLGAGLVGRAMARDLALESDFQVTVADLNPQNLERVAANAPVATLQANLRTPGVVAEIVENADLVVVGVPGFMGYETLRQVIDAGKNVVDISFFPEDPFGLDELAQQRNVTAVVDCGVAPGLSNIFAGYVAAQLDDVQSYLCYVGGLPHIRHWPYEYKVVFSPIDVIEEYTRPARFVEFGQEIVRSALSDIELVNLPGVDTLEAFNTDGLRTLLYTLPAPFKKEKTLRYPGHANLMAVFRDSGFFDTEPIAVDGQMVRPIAVTASLLFEHWRLREGEEDYTVLRVQMEGQKDGRHLRYTYDLLDHFDATTQTTAMARTTGYTATIVARQVAMGLFSQKGICPPEYVGRTPGCYEHLIEELGNRNIRITEIIE
ncbi:MAG: saccharopine dehydrogenase NADP-binding domain-containing protein [Anaerolineales bacterium]|nr:saccharopine dehydrogenase NADP-binding domain-containing protein [Anaerolineales bacterium]